MALLSSALFRMLHLGDSAAATCAMVGGLLTWSVADSVPFTWAYVTEHAVWFLLVVPWMLLLLPAALPAVIWSSWNTTVSVAHAAVGGGVLYSLFFFLAPRDLLPRLPVVSFLVLAFLMTIAWRLVFIQAWTRAWPRNRIAIVGSGSTACIIADILQTRTPHNQVLAFISDRGPAGETTRLPVLGVDRLEQLVAERGVSELVLADAGPLNPALIRAVLNARKHRVNVVQMNTVYEHLLQRLPIHHLEPDDVLALSSNTDGYLSSLAKRAVDIAVGGVGCAVTLVLLPVVGLAIWLDLGWPIFFRQQRVGLGGQPFQVVKFRTMKCAAEPDGPRWANKNDPRTSGFGRFLRRFHLDELPQFWNVLKGEMSLVGPRPERPEFTSMLERAIPYYTRRWAVRPGLTGWAQVNYSYGRSVEDAAIKLEYDLYYIKHRSPLFDLQIGLRTTWAILVLGD